MNYKQLLLRAVENGYPVKVFYDHPDDPDLDYSLDLPAILEAVEACEDINVWINTPYMTEWAHIITCLDLEETVADFTCDGFIDKLWDEYNVQET